MVESSNSAEVVNAAFALVKRLPPKQVAKTLAGLANLVADDDTRTDLMDKIISSLGKYNQII